MDLDRIAKLLHQRQRNHSLPQPFYNDPEILAFDLDAVFATSWLLAGFEAEVPEPGSAMTFAAGRSSVIIARDRDGQLRAFHNTCRHRGSELLAEGCRKVSRLTCPYHQWT
ncbi:MAG TPA: Rieske (2Fe-2S) protein, partial [Stellaceae bacterium]|nr:Rieske (2Fe-2S) protein [Stellaceae bacterium]